MAVNREELGRILREGLAATPEGSESTENELDDAMDTPAEGDEEGTVEDENLPTEELESESDDTGEKEEEEGAEEIAPQDITDLVQLATAIEVEPEFLYNIKIPMADGMESVSLSELKDGYTEYKRGTNADSQDLENKRASFEEHRQKQVTILQHQQQMPQEIMAAQANVMAIASQYQNYDWSELEKLNPGEAALQKQNMASAYQQAQTHHQGLVQKHQQYLKQSSDEFVETQHLEIAKHIPEWNDNTVRVREQDEMRVMMKTYGFSDDDINGIEDSRAMRMARDLWKLKELSSKARKTVKKIAKVPKTLRAGARITGGETKSKKVKEAINRAKNTRSDRGKASQIGKLFRGEI